MASSRTLVLPSLVVALVVLVAACSSPSLTPNTAPTVTIQSPADGTSVYVGTETILAATASDEQDGDLSDDVVWTSDLDGALSPTEGGAVDLSLGAHVLTATVTDSEGLSASDSVSITVVEPLATHV